MLADGSCMEALAPSAMAPFTGIALSLGLGLLVGMQRGWAQRKNSPGSRFAGVRTFGLFGLAGGVGGLLATRFPALSTILLGATALLVLISYYRTTQSKGSISGTASIASLITLACGFLAAAGETMLATTIAVCMVLLLALRNQLHSLIGRMNEAEMSAVARFAVIAAVILPMLPDQAFGPYQAWNPRTLWLVVVLVSGFSFAGYLAARLLGPSLGTLATAAAGSMVSSTAVTAALATRLKASDGNAAILNSGICLGSAVMFLRVMVLTGWLAPFALPWLIRLALPGMLVSAATAMWFLWKARKAPSCPAAELTVRNPFSLGPAIILMLLVMALSVAARFVLARYGDAGLATVLALSGTVDVDSAIITMGGLPTGTLEAQTAALVLVPPILLNTLFKAGTAVSIAGWRQGRSGAAALALSALATAGAVLFVL